jgi:peptidoglycan/LPS O-acetylase OafA/YrhL
MCWAHCFRLGELDGDTLGKRLALWMLPMMIVAIPAVWCIAYDDNTHKGNRISEINGFFGGIALFLFCLKRRAFAAPWLRYAGSISYSVYLFHPLTLEFGKWVALKLAWPAQGPCLVLVVLASTLAVAHLVFSFVEKPAIRIGKNLVHSIDRPAGAVDARAA